MSKSIFVVYGTRPEAIKLAPLILQSNLLKSYNVNLRTVVTGQHKELVEPIHQGFGIEPAVDLQLMKSAKTLNELCAQTISGLEKLFNQDRPAGIIVQGDTTSAFAAGVAAFYQRIPVFHVEAGLRSGDLYSPFPEEFNRRGLSVLSSLHFAPTDRAAEALRRENVPDKQIFVTGNTAIDSLRLLREGKILKTRPECRADLKAVLEKDVERRMVLVTLHRRESFGEPIRQVLSALKKCVESRSDLRVLLFAHLNPNVQAAIQEMFGLPPTPVSQIHELMGGRLVISPPADYFSFVSCMERSYLILTDSGGIQEEAPHLGLPVLVARETTERPEGIEAGNSVLVGTDPNKIFGFIGKLFSDESAYKAMARARNPFGDGYATERIFDAIGKFCS